MVNYQNDSRSISNICNFMHIPYEISLAYQGFGINKVYDWQYDCISTTSISEGESIVYCAPTSGGKTLISELIILRSVFYLKKRAIFVLPYVSLVEEKEEYFKRIIRKYYKSLRKTDQLKVKAFYGDNAVSVSNNNDMILICTIEKANILLNTIISKGLGNSIGCVVVDELHTLGDSFNGYLLEIFIRFVIVFIKSYIYMSNVSLLKINFYLLYLCIILIAN